jgi:hypothetical protein
MQQAPQTPPVHIRPVAYLLYDLWSQVLRGAADGGGRLFVMQDLGESEVCEFDVADAVDDDVFGLETR